jgi:serine/threonine-protein kinase
MQLTQTQSLLGTPAYMSPEQMRSARLVDARTDIWSLGTVFYEVLEGRRPFEAESFSEMCVKVAVDPPAPMVNTPPGLQQVIMRCLAKSPEQRYTNMAELGRDLVPYAADPHAAQMLVERMTRVLRRAAHGDFDGVGTGSGQQRDSAQQLGSGPVPRAQTPVPQQWGSGSDPAASPWNVQSDPQARPWHGSTPRGDGSQPFAQPLPDDKPASVAGPTFSTTKKSRWPLVLLVLLVATGAVAAGVYVAQRDGTPVANQVAPSDDKGTTVQLKETAPAAVVEPKPTVIDKAPPSTEPAPPIVEPTPGEGSAAPKSEAKKPATKTGTAKATKKWEPKKVDGAVEIKKEPAKPCNPFEAMHGCPAK